MCRLHSALEEHGLGLLEEMARDGELDVAERTALSSWCFDAEAKQEAFKRSLDDMVVLQALRELMHVRRL